MKVEREAGSYKRLTEEQLSIKDRVALQYSKISLIAIAKGLRKPAASFPKPMPNALQRFLNFYSRLLKEYDYAELYKAAIGIAEAFSRNRDYVEPNMEFSILAYFLATQGIIITQWSLNWEWFRKHQYDRFLIDGPYAYVFLQELPFEHVDVDVEDIVSVNLESTTDEIAVELPQELINHLASFDTLESVALEICRIQMLGPKVRRAEDAKGALINAWVSLQRSMK